MSLVVTRVFEPQVYTESLFLPSKVLAVGSAEKIVALVVRVIVPGLHVRLVDPDLPNPYRLRNVGHDNFPFARV
jgi:hypothetical protein